MPSSRLRQRALCDSVHHKLILTLGADLIVVFVCAYGMGSTKEEREDRRSGRRDRDELQVEHFRVLTHSRDTYNRCTGSTLVLSKHFLRCTGSTLE